jgi:hypothetical protein
VEAVKTYGKYVKTSGFGFLLKQHCAAQLPERDHLVDGSSRYAVKQWYHQDDAGLTGSDTTGSGKGTNTPAILQARGITNPPIVISSLLKGPETSVLKARGEMVGT